MTNPPADELPDLPDLEELPALTDPPSPPPLASLKEVVAPAAAAPAPPPDEAIPPAGAGGEKPPLRVLDPALAHLRRAAVIVVGGSLLPWMGWPAQGGGWLTAIVGKLAILAGLWLWYQQVQHNWGPKLPGLLGRLAAIVLKPPAKPKDEEEEKRGRRRSRPATPAAPTALEHPFPTALHVLSLVLILAGAVGIPQIDGLSGQGKGIAVAELGMLAWAAGTYVHIHAYERWGRFSPIFPLMFLAMVFGGLLSVVKAFGTFGERPLLALAELAGGAAVAGGGGLAAYTIAEALMQAKKEGDLKKRVALEARKCQRQARQGGGAEPPPGGEGA
ncbi:MAG: hypothetical protein AB1726_01815 [Planctomycetota bacterium]